MGVNSFDATKEVDVHFLNVVKCQQNCAIEDRVIVFQELEKAAKAQAVLNLGEQACFGL